MATNGSVAGAGSATIKVHETRGAAVAGLWRFDGSSAKYLGPSGERLPSYGIALTNWNLTDGTVQVRISFSEVDSKGHISAGIVVGFQTERTCYPMLEVWGWGMADSIVEELDA